MSDISCIFDGVNIEDVISTVGHSTGTCDNCEKQFTLCSGTKYIYKGHVIRNEKDVWDAIEPVDDIICERCGYRINIQYVPCIIEGMFCRMQSENVAVSE